MLFFPGREAVEAARREGEPLLLLVSVDGETAVIAPADEAVEHHILLDRAGKAGLIEGDSGISTGISGRWWMKKGRTGPLSARPGYKGISDKGRRIAAFYRDGFAAISEALGIMRIFVGIRLRGAEAF